MKKKIIIIIIFLIALSFIIYNRKYYYDINNILNTYNDIFNNDYISNNYNYNGTLNYEYHHTDPHGGTSTTYSDSINYILVNNNNDLYLNLNKDNFNKNININNKYLLYYFKLKNIKTDDIKNVINNLNNNNLKDIFNNTFNTNYNNIKYNTKGLLNKEYVLSLDNNKLIIKNNIINYYEDNNKIIEIKLNKKNINITFDNNNISIIKDNNKYKYLLNIDNVPFEITKNNNNLYLQINYVARKYNDFKMSTKYNIGINEDIKIIDSNDTDNKKIPLLEYLDMIKEVKELS